MKSRSRPSNPSRWGSCGWKFLHHVAHTSPIVLTYEERVRMIEFLKLFAYHLPCKECALHFRIYLDTNLTHETVATRARIVKLLNAAHNEVNVRKGKRAFTSAEHYASVLTPSMGKSFELSSVSLSPPSDDVVILLLIALTVVVVLTGLSKRGTSSSSLP